MNSTVYVDVHNIVSFDLKDSISCCGTTLIWRKGSVIICTAKFQILIIMRRLAEYGDDLLSNFLVLVQLCTKYKISHLRIDGMLMLVTLAWLSA